jgi:hypothetical protein
MPSSASLSSGAEPTQAKAAQQLLPHQRAGVGSGYWEIPGVNFIILIFCSEKKRQGPFQAFLLLPNRNIFGGKLLDGSVGTTMCPGPHALRCTFKRERSVQVAVKLHVPFVG